ncbi:LOW QUALITY PROTEIN: hypothetical protein RJ639_031248 [Escallonia herrerae]|uniref:MADS-box domain-containing protein n=1 Tax=Escallonia herrerae TaxID=1293975 RepID=A0AA88WXV1_9ASTE|nr:LOW QUALITY PROTEIN: hypothetical protein RJ639_031248 [Escallonia herrerae]
MELKRAAKESDSILTFSRRRQGVFKKAHKLHKKTSTNTTVLLFSPAVGFAPTTTLPSMPPSKRNGRFGVQELGGGTAEDPVGAPLPDEEQLDNSIAVDYEGPPVDLVNLDSISNSPILSVSDSKAAAAFPAIPKPSTRFSRVPNGGTISRQSAKRRPSSDNELSTSSACNGE